MKADDFKDLATGNGRCIAIDEITFGNLPVLDMSRDERVNEHDSGWQFFPNTEDQAYLNGYNHCGIYDVNTFANYDPAILPL